MSVLGVELFDDPMGDFKDLRQVNSIQDYVNLFDDLLTRVELSEDQVVSCFIRGLKPEISLLVKMLAPRSLAKAVNILPYWEVIWDELLPNLILLILLFLMDQPTNPVEVIQTL